MVSGPMILWQIDGKKVEIVTDFIFLGFKITADSEEMKLRDTLKEKMKLRDTLKENYDKSRQHIKKQRHHFADKRVYNPNYGFPSRHVWI